MDGRAQAGKDVYLEEARFAQHPGGATGRGRASTYNRVIQAGTQIRSGEGLREAVALSVGGRLGYKDDGETPNTQVVLHQYANAPLIFEVRGLPSKAGAAASGADPRLMQGGGGSMDNYRGVDIGNVIDCEGGSVRGSCAKRIKSDAALTEANGRMIEW